MKSICVYCGSSIGNKETFKSSAIELGELLASNNISLVYGGARLGVMGEVANACLQKGGKVLGVIPKFLDRVEISHAGLSELIMTESMHERKTIMAERSEGFIALPGGFGTLEELAEILTWSQLGLVNKPIGILNIEGYYDKLLELFDHMLKSGFIKEKNLSLFVVSNDPEELLEKMKNFNVEGKGFMEKLNLT